MRLVIRVIHFHSYHNKNYANQPFVYNLMQVLSGNQNEQREQQQKYFKSLVMRASNEMMEKLIAGGAEINCVRSDGLTPLMLALSKVHNTLVTNIEKHQ